MNRSCHCGLPHQASLATATRLDVVPVTMLGLCLIFLLTPALDI
jgi:hypothetical protein